MAGAKALVENFFANNYRDITLRETIEWGQPVKQENGNVSIRYKYNATIWDKNKIIENKIFTFDKVGKFVSVKNVKGYPKKLDNTSLKIETNDGFKETIKEILPAAEGRNAKLLDIDTGKWGRKSDFGQNDRETHKWVRENGLDLLGFFERGRFGLLAFDVAVLPVKSPDWQRLAAKDIIENKLLDQMEPNKITPMLPVETADAPATYLFRTRENGIGILQITGFSKNPKGVKVRYKLVGNPTGQVEGEEVYGLRLGLRAVKEQFRYDEIPVLKAVLVNSGERTFSIVPHQTNFKVMVTGKMSGGFRRHEDVQTIYTEIKPGQRKEIEVVLDENWFTKARWKRLIFEPGKYSVEVEVPVGTKTNIPRNIRLLSNPVEFEILPEETAGQVEGARKAGEQVAR